ncbi:pyrroloquinoline quinone biosynthesis protein PqqD [Dulcicalothrix desertica PCC 7102]|uniref:Pyrroloquinoline quinone biosynthesis protein PqqD n=2 Tax=Dulcicalothrix desertica TaxID=32056 RepID=A0A433VS72_9CYAN|nr:pyrroloquinoline quinone biosynthesis protein PqqD [Dulcicalothrix desertica PCC 7102]TWH44132.1 pyrroloquinoline quinone biosynthesis protein D [Dulcicalothrix desertica PCC 7102]
MFNSMINHNCPRLVKGARLFWDDVRQQKFLLFPEGALVLNNTSWDILQLCDGRHTVTDIVGILSAEYSHPNIEPDVLKLLNKITERGFLYYDPSSI